MTEDMSGLMRALVTEYLRDPGRKIDLNFKHWIAKERQF